MSKSTSLIIVSSIVLVLNGRSQDENTRLDGRVYARDYRTINDSTTKQVERGKIKVLEDDRISELDKIKKEYPGMLNGYRVQIFFGKRDEALEQKARFRETHPDVRAYISYLAPNFRLRVGDFRTRMEGEKLKQSISQTHPGSYLVKDKIELPDLQKNEEREPLKSSEKGLMD